jgi:HEAT repeat protein
MPETAPSFAREMVAGCFADEDAWTVEADRALDRLVATPEFAARLVRMLPALPQREMVNCWNKLVHAGVDLTTALPEMAKSADPFVRGLSLDPWTGDDARGPPPAWAVALLDDPDDGVRATAADLVASKGGAPDARVRTVAMALRAAPEPSTRWSAVAALGALAARDPSVLAAVVEALSDESESVRTTAVIALARDDTPIPGPHPEAIARIADGLLDRGEAKVAGRALLRFEGGEELLVATVRDALRHPQEGPANDSPWQIVGAVAAAGPRAAPLRGALEAWRTDDPNAYADAALAEISRDPVELALHGDATTVARLLAMGPAGRRAVPLLVGRADENDLPAMLREVESAALADEIVAAAGTSDDAAHAGVVRMGAARMASGLPAPQAVDVLRSLAADPDADVRTAVVESLVEVERRAPGSVPPLLVAGLFHDEDEQVRHLAVNFVGCRGARARDAVPALREVLRSDHAWDRCLAALALWRVTGDPEEALRLIRPLLERPDQATVFTPWSEIGGALAAMPLGPADRDLLLRALPRAIEVHVRLAILEAIVPLGPAAAPAVPAFRAMLSDAFGAVGESDDAIALGETAARVLAGIGAAARPALPDLRAWIAASGDPHGVARQAVRTISAAR